ncbi:MAG: hypothetical protein K6C30_06595 [Bacteroidaceae bacterium]|nr:hypothetical protein [Bacteroidaceae bacterium]
MKIHFPPLCRKGNHTYPVVRGWTWATLAAHHPRALTLDPLPSPLGVVPAVAATRIAAMGRAAKRATLRGAGRTTGESGGRGGGRQAVRAGGDGSGRGSRSGRGDGKGDGELKRGGG